MASVTENHPLWVANTHTHHKQNVPKNLTKGAKTQARDLRVSFKKTRETAKTICGMTLQKAYAFLNDVLKHKRAVPFRRFNRGVGRTAQAKEWRTTQARWPVKSVKYMLELLKNCEANARQKQLDVDLLYIQNVQVNQAPKRRRRTYRAHGRINPFMSHPSHIQIILAESNKTVPRNMELA